MDAFYEEDDRIVGHAADPYHRIDIRKTSRHLVVRHRDGSACSVQIGVGLTDSPAGSARATCLVVTDIEAARRELTGRGVAVSDVRHKSPVDDWKGGWAAGTDPQRRDYASFADFADPDGNTWVLQEIGHWSRDKKWPGTVRRHRGRTTDSFGGKP